MTSADLSADHRPIAKSKNCRPMEKTYNKVVIILFLSADKKRAKICHFIGRRSADCRRGKCNRGLRIHNTANCGIQTLLS